MGSETVSSQVSIIVPIYADWPSLKDCIESLIEFVDLKNHKVLLVNDSGPEADLLEKNTLDLIKGLDGFHYFRNETNLGFTGTCNKAVLELDGTDNDILLLNSDTKVTMGFLEEMSAVLYSKNKIGAVSPRSNNATIFTIPLSAMKQKGLGADASYKLFIKYKDKFPRYDVVPTAHGFCMLIRRKLIKRYGLFDPVFGKGYGEEVDFCQRIRKDGWLSVISNRAYVFHLEARSFTMKTKAKLLEQNSKILDRRYPEYKYAVRDYTQKALTEESEILENRRTRTISKTRGMAKKVLSKLGWPGS